MASAPETLPATIEACHALIVERGRQVSERDALIARLQHQLKQLLRTQFGRRSEKIVDPNQLALFEQIMAAVWNEPPAEVEAEEGEEEAPRKPRRRGRQPFPAELPRVRVEHDIPEEEKTCPECGTQKEKIDEEVSEQLEYVPARFEVKQHVRFTYACPKECEGQVQTAKKPVQPVEKGVPGPGLVAQIVVSKYCDHLPLYRQETIFERSGVEISRETMWGWIKTLAVEVTPLYELLKAEVLSSHKIHTDDTPVRLRDAKKREKGESRIWTYVGDRSHPYSVFDYTANRRRDGPVAFLGSWKGYLQADAFAGYDCIFASKDAVEVACMAHARRKFEDALATDQEVANEALALIGKLYTLERGWKELADDERRACRQDHSLPLLAKFKLWLDAARGRVLPKSPAGKAIRYALKNWQALCRYTEHGELDIDNNAAERALRAVAIGRKNWLFFGSHVGGKAAAVFFSLIASAKRHGLDSFEYLRDIFERLPAHPADRLAEFLPDKWKQLREKKPAETPAPAAIPQ
jgi:transposase